MNKLPELIETDDGVFVVKYTIETIRCRKDSQCRLSFRIKIGDLYYDVSQGRSYDRLKEILIDSNSNPYFDT